MPDMLPIPEALADWLLPNEVGERRSQEELTMAAVHVYERLHTHLSIFLGNQGFDALWARAIHLVRRRFPWEGPLISVAPPVPHHALDMIVRGRDAAEARVVLLAVFTNFFTVLFSFIGDDLGCQLLRQIWPALREAMPVHHSEETSQ